MVRKSFPIDYRNALRQMTGHVGTGLRRGVQRFDDLFARLNLSIRLKILIALCIVILMMGLTNAVLLVQMSSYTRQYDAIINNITTANSINGYIKPAIDTEMWNIVAGKTEFKSGKQYEIINNVNTQVGAMMANTNSSEARKRLEIIQRTLKTLTHYVDVMGTQIANKSKVAENERVLEDIRSVSSVAQDVVQNYALYEVTQAETQYREMQANFNRWQIFYVVLTFTSIAFAIAAAWAISRSIYIPIKKLHDVTTTITRNDLMALVTSDNVDEITELGMSFNIMIGRIRELLDAKVKEQENLKKAELRALQAQINPHFLYNTLDTIIWMAEGNKTEQVVEIVRALSSFFRLSLSKGRDWITIGEEIERTRSYLTIQKMRYRDIMDFKIEMDPAVEGHTILKLILQPLVENALYHGIKNKRQGGTIMVRARHKSETEILLEVEDNGIGFMPDALAQVQAQLADDSGDIRLERGFGIDNVNKRIKLYYGRQYGLFITSEPGAGTCVSLIIPAKMEETVMPDEQKERVP